MAGVEKVKGSVSQETDPFTFSPQHLTDKVAFEREYDALLNDKFEVEGIPAKELDGMSLAGATWVARIVLEDEAPAEPKKNDASG